MNKFIVLTTMADGRIRRLMRNYTGPDGDPAFIKELREEQEMLLEKAKNTHKEAKNSWDDAIKKFEKIIKDINGKTFCEDFNPSNELVPSKNSYIRAKRNKRQTGVNLETKIYL